MPVGRALQSFSRSVDETFIEQREVEGRYANSPSQLWHDERFWGYS